MGSADLVPGVSGGTIALVIGIYDRLVTSIREGSSALGSLLKGDVRSFRAHLAAVEWLFLLSLLGGILLAVFLLSSLLEQQLEERPTLLAAAFFGLVLGSVVIAWRLITERHLVHFLIGGAVGLALFLVLRLGEAGVASAPSSLAFVGAGALAICAWILPGISGSLILVLIGMYSSVLGAITSWDFANFGFFILGAIIGLAMFSQILYWGLAHYHDLVVAGLVGMMVGALGFLWPWPSGFESAALAAPGENWPAALVAMIVGALVVVGISRFAAVREEAD